MFAVLVSIAGLSIRLVTIGFTSKNTSGRNTTEGQVADTLNTTGIYSTVRHPLYLGNFLMWLGIALWTGNFWFIISFCLFYWVYYERIMFAEESFLRKKFGDRYLEWAEQTPAFFPSLKIIKILNVHLTGKKFSDRKKTVSLPSFLYFVCSM